MPKKPNLNTPEDKNLTSREEKFVEEMAKPRVKSAADAARKAGYSPKTAKQIASENLTKPYILKAIEKRRAEVAKMSKITTDEVFGSAVRDMFSTPDDVLGKDGRFDIKKARRTGAIHLIREISFRETKFGTSISFKMADQAAARREIGEYLGMKQMPRENEERMKRTIQAIKDYLAEFPDADKQKVVETFSRGRGFPVEQILQHLEMEN